MRFLKKVTAGIMVAICVVSMSIPVHAASGYAKKNMKSSYSYTQYNCTFWGQSNFWDVWWGADGTSKTVWIGSNPFNADSITHKDILSCTGIGSMDIGADISSGGAGIGVSSSVSGHKATYTYSVSNKWNINVDFNYKHTGLLAAWNFDMDTKSVVQFGSSFYTWGT